MKAVVVFVLIFGCVERVTSLVSMGASEHCNGEHCHWQTHEKGEEEERPVLYWMSGTTCDVVGKYNPFYDEEPPKFCPEGTEMFWKDPKDWTKEEREALGLVEVDLAEMDIN